MSGVGAHAVTVFIAQLITIYEGLIESVLLLKDSDTQWDSIKVTEAENLLQRNE